MKNPIYPCFWYNGNGADAATFYCSLFNNSKIVVNTPMVVNFELEGKLFMGLNGGPMFTMNPSISMFVVCTSPQEIETLNTKLLEGGSSLMPLGQYLWSEKYAWVKDKFGLTWQLMLGELPQGAQKITPSFLFSNKQFGNAVKAIEQYISIFPNSSKGNLQLYTEGENQTVGNLKFGHFTLNGSVFAAMDGPGNHDFDFSEGISLVVNCDTQDEIDHYWNKLTEGGSESQCGWLKDRYGVSWQIVPSILGKLMTDPQRAPRVMAAFMKMKKFDIKKLEEA